MVLLLTLYAISQTFWIGHVIGHATLISPPSRAAMGLYGYPQNGINYNHNEGNCGGFAFQHSAQSNGRCGICGDPWNANPRQHEAPGGKFANGIITGRYQPGQNIEVTVKVTSNHKGYFTFRLCASNNPSSDPNQACFDQPDALLRLADGSTRFPITTAMGNGDFKIRLRLPNWSCSQCILQWTYTAGNNWGICPDGTGAVGCGPQETFRACADIQISGNTVVNPPLPPVTVPPVTSATSQPTSVTSTAAPSTNPTQSTANPGSGSSCVGTGSFAGNAAMAVWCTTNCNHSPPFCPADRCKCGSGSPAPPSTLSTTTPSPTPVTQPTPSPTTRPTTSSASTATYPPGVGLSCASIGAWAGDASMGKWCFENCNHSPPFCPTDRCECVSSPSRDSTGCTGAGPWSGIKAMEAWCQTNCNHSPPFCPVDMCSCVRQDTESSTDQTETSPATASTTSSSSPCFKKNTMLKGKVMKKGTGKTDSEQDCWTKCDKQAKCKGFTFIAKHKKVSLRNMCYLYTKVKKERKKKGYISGLMDAVC